MKTRYFKIERIYRGCETTESKGDELYLIRLKVVDGNYLGLFLHKFLKPDLQDLHDHPWNFISFIVWRGYKEEYHDPKTNTALTRRVWPGMIVFRKADHRHRVILIGDKPAYTIILRFAKIRDWGFWINEKWIYYRAYWSNKGC